MAPGGAAGALLRPGSLPPRPDLDSAGPHRFLEPRDQRRPAIAAAVPAAGGALERALRREASRVHDGQARGPGTPPTRKPDALRYVGGSARRTRRRHFSRTLSAFPARLGVADEGLWGFLRELADAVMVTARDMGSEARNISSAAD